MFNTTEGWMDLDFEKMELYVQRGDLCWPMVRSEKAWPIWVATCPFSGRQLNVVQRRTGTNKCRYAIQELVTHRVLGTSEEFDLDV